MPRQRHYQTQVGVPPTPPDRLLLSPAQIRAFITRAEHEYEVQLPSFWAEIIFNNQDLFPSASHIVGLVQFARYCKDQYDANPAFVGFVAYEPGESVPLIFPMEYVCALPTNRQRFRADIDAMDVDQLRIPENSTRLLRQLVALQNNFNNPLNFSEDSFLPVIMIGESTTITNGIAVAFAPQGGEVDFEAGMRIMFPQEVIGIIGDIVSENGFCTLNVVSSGAGQSLVVRFGGG